MNRRKFLSLAGLIGLSGMAFLSTILLKRNSVLNKVHSVLNPFKPTLKNIPVGGHDVSVETALNSRCTSDYDDDQRRFHWGMFDSVKKLSHEQVENIITLAEIPRFTDQRVEIRANNNTLTFVTQRHRSGITNDWVMIESGLQQQAVGLISAVLGVGIVFRNLGKDGKPLSNTKHGSIKIKLAPMKPSYNGNYWSSQEPDRKEHWHAGNLPDPVRRGGKTLVSTLRGLKTVDNGSLPVTKNDISQLLWAARGRTPHLYKSKPWGLTIPTWAGIQDISSVYLIFNNKLFKYLNAENSKPTHSLLEINRLESKPYTSLLSSFSAKHAFIVVGKNEDLNRALWEVGYQLLNLILQAKALDIHYRAMLLDTGQKTVLAQTGIDNPIAALAI